MSPHAESLHASLGEHGIPLDFTGENVQNKQPNILFIIADQLSAPLLKIHDPKSVIKTPNIDRLASEGVVFDNAYCNSPLCAPSRFCMITGQLPSKIGAYDNASPLSPDIPTFAHYLRREGYETTLAGKMHYIGKEQHHGYENRLTPDIYPADFGWTVNWDKPDERQEWYHNMSSVLQAGIAVRTNQLDYDEEVIFKSTQYLYDYVRSPPTDRRPFFLTVSMTHPHDPYAISKKYWDRYEGVEIPLPKVAAPDQDSQDPHSKRLLKAVDLWDNPMPEEAILRARRAYFGACSYVDDQVGKLVEVLSDCGLADDTIIVFASDHGDMLGERGLWYKMSWFENSARIPLVVHHPSSFSPRRVPENVSTMDLLPSFVDMVRNKPTSARSSISSIPPSPTSSSTSMTFSTHNSLDYELIDSLDGKSFFPALYGLPIQSEAIGEYMGEGTISPLIMIKRSNLKFVYTLVDPPQLFDLSIDPLEKNNLLHSTNPEHKALLESFKNEISQKWNLQQLHQQVLRSQRQRRVCWQALRQGKFESWDYEPKEIDGGRYIRSNVPLDDLERRARYPVVDEIGRVITNKSSLPFRVAEQKNAVPILVGQKVPQKEQVVKVSGNKKTGDIISVVAISPLQEA